MSPAIRTSSSARARLSGLVVLLSACVSATTHAQPGADLELDRRSYLERVERDAPRWLATPERLEVAVRTRDVARRRPVPWLVAGLSQLDISGQGAPTASRLGVDLPLELGGDRARRIEQADAQIALTEAESAARIRALLVAAAMAYVDASEASANVAARATLLEGYERVAQLDAMRLAQAEITAAQALLSTLERDRAEVELRAAENALAAAELALGRFLASAEGLRVRPTESLAADHAPHDETSLIEQAVARHPSVVEASARLAAAEAAARLVRARRIVDPTLTVEWQHFGATSVEQFRQHANDTLAVLLGIPFPITAPRRADAALAQAEIDAAEAELAALRRRVAADVRVALAREREAEARSSAYEQRLLPRARELVDAMTHAYERGAATAFELVTARRALEEAELAAVGARAALVRAHASVNAAVTGTP